MGGSIVNHGGQNPLEASRLGCKIIHGPNIFNFKDIYNLLYKLKLSKKINSNKNLTREIMINIKKNTNSLVIIKKIEKMGVKIKQSTLKELNQALN
tara:strand:+ start:161 stop:448 length:288 start_codon:yes stop_codon:yes gene_type:complete